MPDDDSREWRETMIDWVEQIHNETHALRVTVQIVLGLSLTRGLIALLVALGR